MARIEHRIHRHSSGVAIQGPVEGSELQESAEHTDADMVGKVNVMVWSGRKSFFLVEAFAISVGSPSLQEPPCNNHWADILHEKANLIVTP